MNSRSSGPTKNDAKTLFSTLHPLSTVVFATATVLAFIPLRNSRFNFHCYAQHEATPTQKSARKCAATSRDFLHERLQSALTRAKQLRWMAQQRLKTARRHIVKSKAASLNGPTETEDSKETHRQKQSSFAEWPNRDWRQQGDTSSKAKQLRWMAQQRLTTARRRIVKSNGRVSIQQTSGKANYNRFIELTAQEENKTALKGTQIKEAPHVPLLQML